MALAHPSVKPARAPQIAGNCATAWRGLCLGVWGTPAHRLISTLGRRACRNRALSWSINGGLVQAGRFD